MKNTRAKVTTWATVVLLGGLGGLALSQGSKAPSAPVAGKPVVRTKVVRRTIHVTRHAKPKHPPAAAPLEPAGAGASRAGVPVVTGSSSTGATEAAPVTAGSSGSSPTTESAPFSTGASSTGTGAGSAPVSTGTSSTGGGEGAPVSTGSSGAGGGGGEIEHEGGGGGDD